MHLNVVVFLIDAGQLILDSAKLNGILPNAPAATDPAQVTKQGRWISSLPEFLNTLHGGDAADTPSRMAAGNSRRHK